MYTFKLSTHFPTTGRTSIFLKFNTSQTEWIKVSGLTSAGSSRRGRNSSLSRGPHIQPHTGSPHIPGCTESLDWWTLWRSCSSTRAVVHPWIRCQARPPPGIARALDAGIILSHNRSDLCFVFLAVCKKRQSELPLRHSHKKQQSSLCFVFQAFFVFLKNDRSSFSKSIVSLEKAKSPTKKKQLERFRIFQFKRIWLSTFENT